MPKQTIVGIFPYVKQDETDQPIWMLEDVPESFLNEEISFGRTAGQTFFVSDLANMWCDLNFMKVLMKHPEAIRPLKEAAKRRRIKVKSISLKEFFHLLTVTDQYLWENNLDTVEDLVTNIHRSGSTTPDELVKNDLDNAFRSVYGVGLGFTA